MSRKLIYVLLDGASDGLSYSPTSLELASMPNLQEIAIKSKAGLVYPIEKGIAPESDTAALSLLGYDPRKYKIPRGILEALGSGIRWSDGDLALRCNFATAKGNIIVDRRVGRSLTDFEAKILENEINENVKLSNGYNFAFRHTVGHRAVLVIYKKDKSLGDNITNLDPGYVVKNGVVHAVSNVKNEIELCRALDNESETAAKLVNEFYEKSRIVLENSEVNKKRKEKGLLEANIILTRDAGSKLPQIVNFKDKFGLLPLCIADMPVEIGISKVLNMNHIKASYKSISELYKNKVDLLKNNLENYDFFFVHIKGADEFAHDGNLEGKVKALEEIDEYFFKPFLTKINLEEVSILVSSDHCTPPKLKSHSGDAVPFILYSRNLTSDKISKYSEKECARGSLGLIEKGYNLLNKVFSLI
jgi:2,3-bisphosphoglycerate-independent phosphoglycerate mutase